MTRRRFLREKLRSIYLWHRYAGLLAALLALWLAVSGILLNHAHELGLDRTAVESDWLLSAYGIQAPPPRSFRAGKAWISQLGSRLYLDTQPIGECRGVLQGAAASGGLLVAVCEQSVWLLQPDGTVIERLDVPAPVSGADLGPEGRLVLHTTRGRLLADAAFLGWETAPPELGTQAIEPRPTPAELAARLKSAYRGQSLDWERVLLDAHSGRLFGRLGVWLMDAAGLLLILLSLSGLIVWWQRRAQRRQYLGK